MKNLPIISICLLMIFMSACTNQFMVVKEPAQMPPPRILEEKPRVALALGGGAFHGVAHLGVLKVLEENKIPIDLIVGTSAGSLIGSVYADRPHADSLMDLINTTKSSNIFDFSLIRSKEGFVSGKRLQKYINNNCYARHIEDTRIPFVAVTTELIEGKSVALSSGPLSPSVNASCAIPGIFEPVIMYDKIFVDGGVLDNVPADIARSYGSVIVIAVDVMPGKKLNKDDWNFIKVLQRAKSLASKELKKEKLAFADIVITPDLGGYPFFSARDNEKVYELGMKAAREALPVILKLLKEKEIALSRE